MTPIKPRIYWFLGLFAVLMGFLGGLLSNQVVIPFFARYFSQPGTQVPVIQEIRRDVYVEESGLIEALDRIRPSMVAIVLPPEGRDVSALHLSPDWIVGSGVILTSDGSVLTSETLLTQDARRYKVLTTDGQLYSVIRSRRDKALGFQVIHVEDGQHAAPANWTPATFASLDELSVGQRALAVGIRTDGQGIESSSGIIVHNGHLRSGSDRDLADSRNESSLILSDAALRPLFIGGPLVTLHGDVIGINRDSDPNHLFSRAIPIHNLNTLLPSTSEATSIDRAFLGVHFIMITPEMAKEQGLSVTNGAYLTAAGSVKAVSSGSPADKAGLKEGDILLEFNGRPLTLEYTLTDALLKYQPGREITLKVIRGDATLEIKVTLGMLVP